jgi:general stress protein YciG
VSEQATASRSGNKHHNQNQDRERFREVAATGGDSELRAIAAHERDKQVPETDKPDRIDDARERCEQYCEQQPAPEV